MHEEDGPRPLSTSRKDIQTVISAECESPSFIPAGFQSPCNYGVRFPRCHLVEAVLDLVKNGDGEELVVAMHHHNRAPPSTRALV
jgi:hypothetical protein